MSGIAGISHACVQMQGKGKNRRNEKRDTRKNLFGTSTIGFLRVFIENTYSSESMFDTSPLGGRKWYKSS